MSIRSPRGSLLTFVNRVAEEIAPRLCLWNDVANFSSYMLPHPNYYVFQPNIEYFVKNNAAGVKEQGNFFTGGGDCTRLCCWCESKMLWYPSRNFDALKDEFVAGYYAPELVPIFDRYFKLMRENIEASGCAFGCYRMTTRDWLAESDFYRPGSADQKRRRPLKFSRERDGKNKTAKAEIFCFCRFVGD